MRGVIAVGLALIASVGAQDPRELGQGFRIPDEGYCDQPRLAVLSDGTWVCVLTTGAGHEGAGGQHVVATRSTDRGRTWSPPVDVEPADPDRPASYAVVWRTPFDRVYAFYTYNGDAVLTLPGKTQRVRADTQGWFCYRWSDDAGATWSPRRRLPMRVTACDRANDWGGAVQMFWAIGRPARTTDGAVVFGFTKLRRYFLVDGEGWFYRCANLDDERDPARLRWELLPDGEHGLRRADFGSVQEEFNVAALAEGRLFCVYRTTRGFPVEAYSDDGGHTWSEPVPMRYAADGRVFKNPRACPKVWRCTNGKYLFWFHHHGGRDFNGRNPAWLCGGVERDGRLVWSQPEIVLFAREVKVRMSYPDLVETGGEYYLAETQKSVARVHAVDATLLEGLWRQLDEGSGAARPTPPTPSVARDVAGSETERIDLPALPDLAADGGFSLGLWLDFGSEGAAAGADANASPTPAADTLLVDAGSLTVTRTGAALRLDLDDGEHRASWTSDPMPATGLHHVVFTVDGGPDVVTVVRDGRLDDGAARPCGWGRIPADLGTVRPRDGAALAPTIRSLHLWNRPLRTAEAIAAFRTGAPGDASKGLQPRPRDRR